MRCRLILLISEHPIQQGIRIRKGGGPHFCDGETRTRRGEEWRILVVGFVSEIFPVVLTPADL